MTENALSAPVSAPVPAVGVSRTTYVLAVLALVSLLNYYDRYLIAILVQPIKQDLHVGDAQIGLLSGAAFAIVYAVMAVPISRFSDRGRQVQVLGVSLFVWSLMTGLCGLASSFPLFLLARLGVGLGEAGAAPTTYAIAADHAPKRWQATALSAISMLSGVGIMAATAGGGLIADRFGWRAAFWVGAAPGPLLALILLKTVKLKPARPMMAALQAPAMRDLPNAIALLFRRRSFALVCAGFALTTVATFGLSSWGPTFLIRQYGLSAARVGADYGSIVGVATIAGLFAGGVAADVLARRDERWLLTAPALAFIVALPCTVGFLTAHNYAFALAWAGPMTFAYMFAGSPIPVVVQRLAGPVSRATAMATWMLIYNLAGMSLGPLLVGQLSDWLAQTAHGGANPLGWALMAVSCFYLAGAGLLYLGRKTLLRDMAL